MSTTVLVRPAFNVPQLSVPQIGAPRIGGRRLSVPRVPPPRTSVPTAALPCRPETGRRRGVHTAAPRRVRDCAAPVPLRLTRRGRLVLTCTAATVLTGAVLAVACTVGGPSASAGSRSGPAPAVVTVLPGQTLSQIAGDLAPGQDWREVAAEIVELNELSSQALQSGQRLTLPDPA